MAATSSQIPLFDIEPLAAKQLPLRPYVPVLLAKRGELQALESAGEAWASMTPLVQMLVVDDDVPAEQAFSPAAWVARLRRAVGDHQIYLDPAGVAKRAARSKMTPPALVDAVYEEASRARLAFVPVYTVGRTDVAAVSGRVAATEARGLAFRVRLSGLTYAGGRRLVDGVVAEFERIGVAATSTDLMVDLGYIDRDTVVEAADLHPLLLDLEVAAPWRTVTIAATTVPSSFAGVVEDGELDGVARREWPLWKGLRALGHEGIRYSDYAIQNCVPPDLVNNKYMRASIRYSTPDWLFVARGVGPVGPLSPDEKAAEYRDLAIKMMLHPPFVGRACCSGDLFIEECADGLREVRAQHVWRGIGTLHHVHMIALAIAQYVEVRAVKPSRRLPSPSMSDVPVVR